jgi:hypothetical protein
MLVRKHRFDNLIVAVVKIDVYEKENVLKSPDDHDMVQ